MPAEFAVQMGTVAASCRVTEGGMKRYREALLITLALFGAGVVTGNAGYAQGPSGFAIPATSEYLFLAGEFGAAVQNSLTELGSVDDALRATGGRGLPRSLWNEIGLSFSQATYSAVEAAPYRSVLLPALVEIDIGLSEIKGLPRATAAQVQEDLAANSALAIQLRAYNGATGSQSSFVSHLGDLMLAAGRLEGIRFSGMPVSVAPNSGTIRPSGTASGELTASTQYFGGYQANLRALDPLRAAMLVPKLRCPPRGPQQSMSTGIDVAGYTTAEVSLGVTVTAGCDDGVASYELSLPHRSAQRVLPGDHLVLTVKPGAVRSVESIVDATKHFALTESGPGVAVVVFQFGVQSGVSVSVGVAPPEGDGGLPGIGSTTFNGAQAVPAFSGLVFDSCTIGGRALSTYYLLRDDLSSAEGRPEVMPGDLIGGHFSVSRVA
jgi:hypothetical protein